MAVQYRIGEFSNLSGVSAKTLRFYDEIGLLRPASVDSRTGYRHYLPQQLEQLASILALKNLGVSLADVRNLPGWDGAVGRTVLFLCETSRLGHQVILLRDTCRPAGCNAVVLDGAFAIANHLKQMGTNCVQTIVTSKPIVGIERF